MSGAGVLDAAAESTVAARGVATDAPGGPARRAFVGLAPVASRKLGAALALVGLLSVAVAMVGVTIGGSGRARPPENRPPARELTTVVDASTVRTNGPADLVLQVVTYGPGQSSGWHAHPGLHLVSVSSGVLTVYGADCQPQTIVPGVPYLGGDRLHLARNETEEPVEMAVTYVVQPGHGMEHFRIDGSAPPNCPVA